MASRLWWKTTARNKRCIALDLKTGEDADIFKALVADADVLVENFRTGTLESWGLGWNDLSAINPRLVMVRVTGFGQTGPYRRRAGFGTLAEAMSGFAHITGRADGPPTLPPFGLADGIAAYFGCFAVNVRDLRARRSRQRQGQYIDLAIYEPIFALLGPQPITFDQLAIVQKRTGNRSVNNAPRNAYRTRDNRWVALSAAAPKHRPARSRADRRTRRRRRSRASRPTPIASGMSRRSTRSSAAGSRGTILRRSWTTFEKVEAAIAPIYDIEQIFRDPQFVARQSITTVDGRRPRAGAHAECLPDAVANSGADPLCWRAHRPASGRNSGRIARFGTDGRCPLAGVDERSPASPRRTIADEPAESRAAYPRDLIGYADERPDPRWPGGARIAVQFAINYEEGSEYTVADGDARTELGLAEAAGGRVPAGQRDLAFETMYEFGSRVGIWRLFRIFGERQLPDHDLWIRALALERNPRVAEAIAAAGYDVCCHGWRWEEHFQLERGARSESGSRARSPQSRRRRASVR